MKFTKLRQDIIHMDLGPTSQNCLNVACYGTLVAMGNTYNRWQQVGKWLPSLSKMVPTENMMSVNNIVRVRVANQNGRYYYTLVKNIK